jgi:AI-2 transport protein TqsA
MATASADQRPHPVIRVITTAAAVLVVLAGFHFGRTVLAPLAAGLFLAIVARPVQVAVRARLSRRVQWVGVLVATLVILAGIGAFASAMALSGNAVVEEFKRRRPQLEQQLLRMRGQAAQVGVEIPAPPGAGGSTPQGQGSGGSGAAATIFSVFKGAGSVLGGLLLAVAFAALGLAEADIARRRIQAMGEGSGPRRALAAIDEAAPALRRYLWVKSITSVITGVVTGLAAYAFGLPLAWVWGFLAFLFEYVPSVGSIFAMVPPTLVALADGGPTKALTVMLTIGTAQVLLSNVLDPKLEGHLMDVSPFGVLLSIIFWGFLWGAPGALLGVPLTVLLVVVSRHVPGGAPIATLLAGDGVRERGDGDEDDD